MSDLHATLRALLGLADGVILSAEEMDYAVTKAPKADQDKLRLAVIREKTGQAETIAEHNAGSGSAAGMRVPGDETGTA